MLALVKERDPNQEEFYQAVEEVVGTLAPLFEAEPKYVDVMKRIIEPERVIQFRVAWTDSAGKYQVNRGFRVQFNSAIGPYKGGIRFHPSVNLSIVKFLGYEQIFKNSLTTLAMGGGKGGSDFDPKGKSDVDVMRFCQSFMTELQRHIGADTDVPAGDIGVGGREIGYMYGQYKRLRNEFTGVLTGKGREYGGSLIRPEATGYGCVYFALECLTHLRKTDFKGKRVLVSGSGNVAQFAVQKLIQLGAIPLTMSDSSGYILEPEGFNQEKLEHMMHIKNNLRGRVADYSKLYPNSKFVAGGKPWSSGKADVALPCATQNEIDEKNAQELVDNGVFLVCEGANMPSTAKAVHVYVKNNIIYGPAKAANAGGVATSGLEMAQNSQRLNWTSEEVDAKLLQIMKQIYQTCTTNAAKYCNDPANLMAGANIGGFVKVADAMIAQGCV